MNAPDLPYTPAIDMRDVSLSYGTRCIFDGLDFSVPAGRFVAVVGRSGAGKTSLLKLAAGLVAPDAGRVQAGPAAYMGQTDLLLPWLSARGNVVLGARLRRGKPDFARAQALLEAVGLADFADHYPASLSGGMRQRVALARTLYEDRPLVLMDEPFSALDAVSRARMAALAKRMLAGRTVMLITHDPAEACALGDAVLVLAGTPGRLIVPGAMRTEAVMDVLLEESKNVLF